MSGGDEGGGTSPLWAGWARQLDAAGVVELVAGRRVVARVDAAGVLLPSRDLLVRWQHLGFADGEESPRLLGPSTGFLRLSVSRSWWAAHIVESTGEERRRAERELANGWAEPTVSFRSWRAVPVGAFGDWLSAEIVARAPLPDRFLLSPVTETSVFDRDTNRPVPLDRLPIGHVLRERLAAWGAAADTVPAAEGTTDEAWRRFLPDGRALALSLQEETGRPAAVWADCPDAP
jgi:hypothetical protein